MKIFLTGVTGYIGKRLLIQLLEEGHTVVCSVRDRKRFSTRLFQNHLHQLEIVENDFNLNIPRYVDTFEEEEPISLTEVSKELFEINQSIADAEKELFSLFQELVGTTDEAQADLDGLLKYFQKAGDNDE